MKKAPKIIAYYENPPIPCRSFDWCAYEEGEEDAGRYGWGKTRFEAIVNLTEILSEEDYEA